MHLWLASRHAEFNFTSYSETAKHNARAQHATSDLLPFQKLQQGTKGSKRN